MPRATVRGTQAVQKQIDRLIEVGQGDKLEAAVVTGALVLQNGGKRRAPRRTSTLRRSIHIGGHQDLNPDRGAVTARGGNAVPEPERTSRGVTVYVGTNLEYAAIQEFGGTIKPRRAKALVFRIGSDLVFAQRVRIPAQPYMRPTADEDGPEALRDMAEQLAEFVRAVVP